MPRFVSIHTIRSLPSNLVNADGKGMPKKCWFGGGWRTRISSQAIKYAWRQWLINETLSTGVRTRLVVGLLADFLVRQGRDPEEARLVAQAGLQALGLGINDDKTQTQTQTLLFLGRDEILRLGQTMHQHETWTPLLLAAELAREAEGKASKKALRSAPGTKDAREALVSALDVGSHAVDLALFGRMIADRPSLNVDACMQVAHAFSVHPHRLEGDLWIAADDLVPAGGGAAMLQRSFFSTATFYSYACLDVPKLSHNLGDDPHLTRQALDAIVYASILALPAGRKNSFSAYTPTALTLVQVADRQPFSLANAFLSAVYQTAEMNMEAAAIAALDAHLARVNKMYSLSTEMSQVAGATLPTAGLMDNLTVEQLVERTIAQVFEQ
jgi:CRISPR system Cascade subunit CasC